MEELKTPSVESLRRAYFNGNEETKKLLETLYDSDFLTETKRPSDIKERVKTFADAVSELSDSHPQVVAYKAALSAFNSTDGIKSALGPAVVAFMQLGIITAALNEGWTPDWGNDDEWKYYPWFYLYSKEEWDNLSEEDKSRFVGRANNYANAYGGLVYSLASGVSAYSHTDRGLAARLQN